jgi:hypothetical protein
MNASTKQTVLAMAVVGSLVASPAARAAPPHLLSVTAENRHALATFSAPRADFGTIYFASRPDRATSGEFLSENVKHLDVLTDSEIQSGRYLDESQLDPGTYWVMLRVSADFDSCWIFDRGDYDPACANGYSNVVQLIVPKPAVRYRTRATAYRFLREVTLTLTAAPLGESVPYRVCGRISARRQRCVRGTVDGFSWSFEASDTVSMTTRGLPRLTTFTWYVGSRAVASRRVRVR